MQYKLLNYYNLTSNFATNLVSAFIPLIVYKSSGSLMLAVLYILCQNLVKFASNQIFKKAFLKYPQLFLILRIIPLTLYNVFLILMDNMFVLSLIMVTLCYGINVSFKLTTNIVFNYSSNIKKTNSQLIVTRMMEYLSLIISSIAGGLFLDFNQNVLIIISLSLYFVSALPLFIYFIVHKKEMGFNKDYISTAVLSFKDNEEKSLQTKKLTRTIILNYFVMYSLFCIIDAFTNMYNLNLFINNPTFTKAGYITSLFYISKLVAMFCIPIISKKFNAYIVTSILMTLTGVAIVVMPYINNNIVIAILFCVYGFGYSTGSYYMMNSIMSKTRILGINNEAMMASQDGITSGTIISSLFVMCVNSIIPVFYLMLVAMIVFAIYFPIIEERMRKQMVDYLNNNEIK